MKTKTNTYADLLFAGRFRLWVSFAGFYLAVSTLTRIALFSLSVSGGQAEASNALPVLSIGLVYDAATVLYLLAPFGLYLALLPGRIYHARWHRRMLWVASALTVFGLLYLAAVEYFFFEEFNSRFNFVAVEYLIYPHEVFVNIWDSYPVGRVLVAAALLTVGALWLLRRSLSAVTDEHTLTKRATVGAMLLAMLAIAHFGLNSNSGRFSENRVVNELALNGVYTFFSAAVNSEIDYAAFYLTLPDEEADRRLRQLVAPDAEYLPYGEHLERRVTGQGKPRRLNVVVLLEESLGAEFVGAYGDRRGLTPHLDRLATQSLIFDNAYATGTRTVRGIEAVTASFPPVPPDSIVKRPGSEGMFNWSTVMTANGYSPTFIYGGYGTFDNMNRFFGSNGYRTVDRTDMDMPSFQNIWGVSDVDLFRNAVRVFDRQHARGERIFSVVLSTSNHKPFTFPSGVPGIPEKGGGREAGIRYADHAIGSFFDMAQTRPWFDDTLFVIVADHGARVYGREDIPVPNYEIPLLVYSPRHVKPGHVETLVSQIDIAPTVLGMLNFSYESLFFGIDVLHEAKRRRSIPLNHNRDIALFDGSSIVEIGFRKTAAAYAYDRRTQSQRVAELRTDRLEEVIAVFQEAYELYSEGLYRLPE